MALWEVVDDINVPKFVLQWVIQGPLAFSLTVLCAFVHLFCLFSRSQSPPFAYLSKCSSINPSKFALSQGSGVPKGINKSCQGFWPLWLLTMKIISPGSQSWLPSSLWQTDKYIFCVLMSAWRECSLYLTSILFSPFSQCVDLSMASTPWVWGHWLREEATRGHQSDGQILAEESLPLLLPHFCCPIQRENWTLNGKKKQRLQLFTRRAHK